MIAPSKLLSGQKVSSASFNAVLDLIRSQRPAGDPTVRRSWGPGGVRLMAIRRRLSGLGASDTWTLDAVVVDSATRTVTFRGGTITHGFRTIQVPSATVSIGGGTLSAPHYVFLEYTIGGSARINPTASAVYPASDPNTFRQVLRSYYYAGATLTSLYVHHRGDINLSGIAK